MAIMNMSKHSDPKVRQAYEFLISLPINPEPMIEALGREIKAHRGSVFAGATYLTNHFKEWITPDKVLLVIVYYDACKEVQRAIKRLKGKGKKSWQK